MDALSEILAAMRLTGGIFLDAEFTAPWCVTAKVGPEDCSPYVPEPRNIIAYHYVCAGRLVLQVEGQSPIYAKKGEIIILPRNDEHRLASALNLRSVRAETLIEPAADGGVARIVHGGGGDRTHVICGFLGGDTPNDALLGVLPKVLAIDAAEGASAVWIESSLRFAAHELTTGRVDSPTVLAKLAELLFAEAVRRYVRSLSSEEGTWVGGIGDRFVGRALALIHGRTAERWTTEKLAHESNLSRSAFAEHFTRRMGEPPMRYLARWRMQLAARRLRESDEAIARIAVAVGYDSEAAFNRAFKRQFGLPPAAWRMRGRGSAVGR